MSGTITHRVSPQAARYTPAGGREKCSFCRFYIAPKWCGHVTGPVSPMGWCKYFSQEMRQQFGGGIAAGGAATFDQSFLGGTLGAGAVFTRASPGWYYNSSGTLVSATTNTPRFDYDPATLQLKGLLLEDASTNILFPSGNIAGSPWSTFNNVVIAPVTTANQTTAPDGTSTATRIVYPAVTGANAASVMQQIFTLTASVYAFSVYLKGNVGGEQLYLGLNVNSFISSPRLILTTQWQRFVIIATSLAGAQGITIGTDLRDPAQTSTPAQTIFAWGGQVELNFMSSYIPTTTVAVTRAADVLSYPIASVSGFSQTQGSLSHEYILEGSTPTYNAPAQLVGASNSTDFIFLGGFTTPLQTPARQQLAGMGIAVGGTTVANSDGAGILVPINTTQRGAVSWRLNAQIISAFGGVGLAQLSGPPATLPAIVALTINGMMLYQSPLCGQWARRTRYWPRQLSQSELIAATTLDGPTLTLDFMQPGSLDPRIVFTRASSATYTDASGVVRTVATNAPRWDYAGGVLRGLLIEEQRANGVWPSTNWNNVPLSPTQDGWIPNIGTSPSGANDAMGLIPCVVNTVHQFFVGFFGAVNTTYTYSVYVKAAGYKFVGVSLANNAFDVDQTVQFDLSNGTIRTQTSNGSGKIQPMGNGWYRCSVTNTSNATGGNYISNVILYDDTANFVFAGDGVKGAWVFGQQVEVGAFPTSYIPTTSVAVTRAADVVSMPTNVSWFNANFGTLHGEFIYTGQLTSSFGHVLDLVGADSNIDSIGLYVQQTVNTMNGQIRNGGTNGYVNGGFIITPGTVVKSAIAYQPTVASSASNGAVVSATALTTPLPVVTSLWFMQTPVGYQPQPTGYFRRVTYWNRALSDTEMQQVTT
jgi:hypothetical protein